MKKYNSKLYGKMEQVQQGLKEGGGYKKNARRKQADLKDTED